MNDVLQSWPKAETCWVDFQGLNPARSCDECYFGSTPSSSAVHANQDASMSAAAQRVPMRECMTMARGQNHSSANRKSVHSAAQHARPIHVVQRAQLPIASDGRLRVQAYRKRVLETHPDKAPVKTAANADAFAELQAAYALIRDEDVRRQFDLQMRIGRYGPVNATAATRCVGDVLVERLTRRQSKQFFTRGGTFRRTPCLDLPDDWFMTPLCVSSVGDLWPLSNNGATAMACGSDTTQIPM